MNKELTTVPTKILQNKLGVLALRLQQQADPSGNNPDFNTLEKTITASVKILSEFYRRLSEPNYEPEKIIADMVPDPAAFNRNFESVGDDLEVVFAEFENLEGVIMGSFNYLVSRMNRLNGKMKAVYSNLGDYILYADLPTKDAIFFQDSFNDLSRMEAHSPLLSLEQCEVNQTEGIVTLPIDRESERIIRVETIPVINENSNGVVGNNFETNAEYNSDISVILDNNADTWFEYERVLAQDDGVPLVFDFTITMRDPKIINSIRINPNNFGTKTQVEILTIDTSLDGNSFVSIKDDIPIAGFIVSDEENTFVLAPSTSKYAGQGIYSFTPRKVKHIRLSLRQSTPYIIQTDSGARSRYAIGIRDVEVRAIPYKVEGEIISTSFNAYDDVRKVAIYSNQNPDPATFSLLAAVEHYISPDDGITWHRIRPLVSAGIANALQEIPETLDFNGIGDTSIATSSDVLTLRYKAVLKRYPESFVSDAPELAKSIVEETELHDQPATTPFEMTLQERPIDDTIEVIEVLLGSRGDPSVRYPIAQGNGSELSINLPFKNIKHDWVRTTAQDGTPYIRRDSPFTVYVDGVAWTEGDITQPKQYRFNGRDGKLTFSTGLDGGTAVPDKAVISTALSEERLYVGGGKYHAAQLAFATPTDKTRTEIRIKTPSLPYTTTLERGALKHQLLEDIDSSVTFQFSTAPLDVLSSGAFGSEVTFIDGATEFYVGNVLQSGAFSVDYTNGTLYCPFPTHMSEETTVSFSYFPSEKLANEDWTFVNRREVKQTGKKSYIEFTEDEDSTGNIISIAEDKFITFPNYEDEYAAVGQKKIVLENGCIIPSTFKVIDEETGRKPSVYMSRRVPWVGKTQNKQLTTRVKTKETVDVMKSLANNNAIYSYTFKRPPVGTYYYWYSRGQMTRNKSKLVNNNLGNLATHLESWGDFAFVHKGGKVTLYVWGPQTLVREFFTVTKTPKYPGGWKNPGIKLTYYWKDYRRQVDGRYSVNWETGEVVLAEKIPSNYAERLKVSYRYTNYYARYDVGRGVPETEWDYLADNNSVVLHDSDKIKSLSTPMDTTQVRRYYQISYDRVGEPREDVGELEQYFSPVLKDYALKVVTKSRLI